MQNAPPGWGAQVGRVVLVARAADYPLRRTIRPRFPRIRVLGDTTPAVVRMDGRWAAAPMADMRISETRVLRAPVPADHPRPTRSGGQNPIGRHAMNRPVPCEESQCDGVVPKVVSMSWCRSSCVECSHSTQGLKIQIASPR